MTDEHVFAHDAAVVSFDSSETEGITVDEDDGASFDWDEVPVVEVDEPPHARAFDSDQFYKIEGATTARPIKQPYMVGDEVEVYVKPADELREAAWSLDNRPYVLGHPSTGMVKDTGDVHGFWRNPRYDDEEDRLKEDLYIPVNDEEAQEFIEENQDVSLGFYNRVLDGYDGDIGDIVDDTSDVDGYQTDIYTDHIAGVGTGRCSSAHGCGLDNGHDHGTVVMNSAPDEAAITSADGADENSTDDADMEQTTDQPSGIKTADGTWFAVGPGEHTKDSTDHAGDHMFPVDNCSDVEDAWNLRGHAEDLTIDQSTLEARIRRAGDSHSCSGMPWQDSFDVTEELIRRSADRYRIGAVDVDADDAVSEYEEDMTDNDDGGNFDVPDLSIDAIAEQNDAVEELVEERDELREDLDAIREDLGLDEGECPCEADLDAYADARETVDELRDTFDEDVDLVDFVSDMHEEWQESRDEKHEEALDRLEELEADRDEWEDESIEEIQDEIERREEIAEEFDVSSVSGDTDTGDEDEATTNTVGQTQYPRGHAA